jgi:hypothetical protein
MWDQVLAYINKHLLAKVGNKKVGGFASTDGLARPWMKDKAFSIGHKIYIPCIYILKHLYVLQYI